MRRVTNPCAARAGKDGTLDKLAQQGVRSCCHEDSWTELTRSETLPYKVTPLFEGTVHEWLAQTALKTREWADQALAVDTVSCIHFCHDQLRRMAPRGHRVHGEWLCGRWIGASE